MPIGYTKLKSGDWGVRGPGTAPEPGAQVTVVKRDGNERKEVIGEVLWSGEDKRTGGKAWMATVARVGTQDPAPAQQPAPRPAPRPEDTMPESPILNPFDDDATPF